MQGINAGFGAHQGSVPLVYPFIHFKCLVQVKMIHPTDLVENQTVKAQRHLPMNPSCRTRERPVATDLNRFEERHLKILFGNKHPNVKYFIFFCNLVNILHAGPAAAATKIQIQIRGFLQMGQNTVETTLAKLLKCCPVSESLSGKRDLCKGGLYGNDEYDTCRTENSTWMPIQTKGDLGITNKGRLIASSDVLSFVFHLN
jgi:hypothetical protein